MKKITIVGCGSVGFIHAYFFAQKGFEISFLKTSDYNSTYFNKVKEDKLFSVMDRNSEIKEIKFNKITTRPEEVIPEAEIILIATTTLQHEKVAEKIASFLTDNQIICIMPSYASSLIFKKYIKNKKIKFVEFETTLFNGRIIENSYININFKNCRMAAYFDGFSKEEIENFSSNIFPISKEAKNTFEIAFHNPNMIVHTIGVLLSASRIEFAQGEFWMYKEAFTPSIIKVIQAFDREKNNILKALGCQELTYFDAAKWRNEEDLSQDSLKVFKSFAEDSNKGPAQLRHRYLLEDVPMGLNLFKSVGKVLGIETKIAEAIIVLSSNLLEEDFILNGRNLNNIFGRECTFNDLYKISNI